MPQRGIMQALYATTSWSYFSMHLFFGGAGYVRIFLWVGQFILIQFKPECGTAKLSLSLFVLFSFCGYVPFIELIHLNYLLV